MAFICSASGEGGTDYVGMAMDIREEIYNHALQLDLEIDPAREPLRQVHVTDDRARRDVARAE